jgi:hypothetical protein
MARTNTIVSSKDDAAAYYSKTLFLDAGPDSDPTFRKAKARTAQRNRKTGMPSEISAWRDRANQRGTQYVEPSWRHDQYETRSSLFATLGGIQIDVVDVATIHLNGLSSHVRCVQPCFVLF